MSTGIATTDTSTADAAAVGSMIKAFANRDLAAVADAFHEDAAWNHRNDDRLGGVHRGSDRIIAFIGESAQLTAGTFTVEPQSIFTDGAGHVCAIVRVTGTRPDGRSMDDLQAVLFSVDAGRIRTVDQFVGDPRAVQAFWE
jgi:ketosteroid isomerase-like protein